MIGCNRQGCGLPRQKMAQVEGISRFFHNNEYTEFAAMLVFS